MPTVWAYIRVSDELQLRKKDDCSLDTQKHVITQWWDANKEMFPDHEFARDDKGHLWFYSDPAFSASKVPLAKRPQGQAMLARAAPGDIIVVARLDRIFRSTKDTQETMDLIVSRGMDVISINEPYFRWRTASDRMVGKILATVAEHESERLGERISMAHKSRVARGLPSGGWVPIGWVKKKKIVDDRVVIDFVPCKAERWWIRIFRWMRKMDPKIWTQANFQRWVFDQEHCRRGAKGEKQKWYWTAFNLAAEIVRRDFPKEMLINGRQRYARPLVSPDVIPVRPRSARKAPAPPKPAPGDWLAKAWTQGRATSRPKRSPQCPGPEPQQALEASPEHRNSPDPENSGPSP